MRTDDRHLGPLGRRRDRRDRADAGRDRHPVRRTGRSRRQYLRHARLFGNGPVRPSHRPGFSAKRAPRTARFGAFFAAFALKTARKTPLSAEKAHHESCRCPRIEDRPRPVRFHRQGGDPEDRDFARRVLGRARRHHPEIWRRRTASCSPSATRLQAKIDDWHRAHKGKRVRHERLHGVPRRRSAISCRSRRPRRSRPPMSTKRSARSADRSSSCPSPMRAMR